MAMTLKKDEEERLMRDVRLLLRRIGDLHDTTPWSEEVPAEAQTTEVPDALLIEAQRLSRELDRFE